MATSPDSFMHPTRSAMMRESRSPSLESSASKEEQYPDVIHGAPMERKPDVMGAGAELTLDLQAYGPRDPADYSRALSVATVRGRLNKQFFDRELDPTRTAPDTNPRGNQEFHTCAPIEYARAIARATINGVLYKDYFDNIVNHVAWNLQETPLLRPRQHLALTLRQSTEPRDHPPRTRSPHTPATPVSQPSRPLSSSGALPCDVQLDREFAQLPVQESIEPRDAIRQQPALDRTARLTHTSPLYGQALAFAGPKPGRDRDANCRRSRSPRNSATRAPNDRARNRASTRRRGNSRVRRNQDDQDPTREQYRSRDYPAYASSPSDRDFEAPPRFHPALTVPERPHGWSGREAAVHQGEQAPVSHTNPAVLSSASEFGVEMHFSSSELQRKVNASKRRIAQILHTPEDHVPVTPLYSRPPSVLELPSNGHSSNPYSKNKVAHRENRSGAQPNKKTAANNSLGPVVPRPLALSAIETWQKKNQSAVCIDCWLKGLACDSQTDCGQCVKRARPCAYVSCPLSNCKGVNCPAYHTWKGDEKKRVVGCNLHLVALLKLRPGCSPTHDVRRIEELFARSDTAQAIHARISASIQEAEVKGKKIDSVLVKDLIVEHKAYHTLQHRVLLPKVNMIVTFVSEMKQPRYQELYKHEKRLLKFGK